MIIKVIKMDNKSIVFVCICLLLMCMVLSCKNSPSKRMGPIFIPSPLAQAIEDNNIAKARNLLTKDKSLVNKVFEGSPNTPLFWAIEVGKINMVDLLISFGANVNVKSGMFHEPPLFKAIEGGHLDIVELLIKNGADINSSDKTFGDSSLFIACSARKDDIVKYLLAHGAKVNFKNADHKTPLHVAMTYNSVKYLLQYGAKCNEQDIMGSTPLHYIANDGQLSMVRLLVEHGANTKIKDVCGNLPIDRARDGKYNEIVSYLTGK